MKHNKIKNKTNFIHGFNALKTALTKKPFLIEKVYLADSRNDSKVKEIKAKILKEEIKFEILSNHEISNIIQNDKHQGFLASISGSILKNENELIKNLQGLKSSKVLILDSIQDPRNLGACLRSALAFGVDAVILNRVGSAPINEYTFKASVGAVLGLDIYEVTNLSGSIEALKKIDYWVIGLDGYSDQVISSDNLTKKIAIVLGSEGSGIRKLVKRNCDHLFKIPIANDIESLNISVAAGIALYEFSK